MPLLLEILTWLVVGLIVGLIARLLLPGRDPMGLFATSLVGIAGAIVGGFLSRLYFQHHATIGFVRPGWIASILGAILVLIIVRTVRR
jgi:uncharacterized membrane protein YeaQ/YmgE (transglycosylase-associated protein family)